MTSKKLLHVLLILFITLYSCKEKKDEHLPEASLADLKVYDALEVTLFAPAGRDL